MMRRGFLAALACTVAACGSGGLGDGDLADDARVTDDAQLTNDARATNDGQLADGDPLPEVDGDGGDAIATDSGTCLTGYRSSSTHGCEPIVEMHRRTFVLSNGRKFTYYGNHDLGATNPTLVRAVVVVHGTNRNADDYYLSMWRAAAASGAQHETLVIAPAFRIPSDSPAPDEIRWSDNDDWKSGDPDSLGALASFAVLDQLSAAIASDRFPSITKLIFAGHSAGGQVVQRHALTSPLTLPARFSRAMFVIANPSSYAYLDGTRWIGGAFVVPSSSSNCGGTWDNWKYGLSARSGYAAARTVSEIRAQFRARDVVYLMGSADTSTTDPDLATGCAAMLQGSQRYERGERFFAHVAKHYGMQPHRFLPVPGVGHSHSGMFQSTVARTLLFGK